MLSNVLDYLDNIVEKFPEKTAFVDDEISYSFCQVEDMSNRIGTYLFEKGFYRQPIVVFMRKSPRTIVTFLGVIRSGCFYVPIDEEMPESRMNLILENCSPQMIICDDETLELAKNLQYQGEFVTFQELITSSVNTDALFQIREKALDIDPVYIVFTSGSTGVPKGVCACHRSVIDYIEQLSSVIKFDENTVFGNQTPLYFDACLKEIYPTLKFGATLYLIPHQYFMFPIKLVEYLNEKKINTICWVVSALTMISAFGTFNTIVPKYLHTICFGSEVFPIKEFNKWREAVGSADFFNLYGPTEGTGMCCYYHVDRDFGETEAIPIGRPFRNTEILLLDEKNKPAVEGEICIRGTCVTLGYYNNSKTTDICYVQNPLQTAFPELIYRTGDIGRYNDKGELMFVSRRDYQIKHMGHRIELGEIEANVNALESVKMSACIYDKERDKIILFYVGVDSRAELSAKLKAKLPRYMLPNKTVQLEKLPFTANGKIDRNALKKKWIE